MVQILPFSEENSIHFTNLNTEWLEKYFYLEARDIQVLSNPNEEIIKKGGQIFFAQHNEAIVGTLALIKINKFEFELSKMAVTNNLQGLGIGYQLMQHCFDFCKNENIQKLIIYSNTKLEKAIYLYKKVGFIEIELNKDLYERADIKMEKIIM